MRDMDGPLRPMEDDIEANYLKKHLELKGAYT